MKDSEKGGTEQDKTVEVSSSRYQRSLGEDRPSPCYRYAGEKNKNVGTAATNGNHTREAAETNIDSERPADSLWPRFQQLINAAQKLLIFSLLRHKTVRS